MCSAHSTCLVSYWKKNYATVLRVIFPAMALFILVFSTGHFSSWHSSLAPFSLPSAWSLLRDVYAWVCHLWWGFFWLKRRLRANIQFIFYCSVCNRGTYIFSNPVLLMERSKWICTYRYISEDIFYPLWNTKMPLKQNVCSDFLCVCA